MSTPPPTADRQQPKPVEDAEDGSRDDAVPVAVTHNSPPSGNGAAERQNAASVLTTSPANMQPSRTGASAITLNGSLDSTGYVECRIEGLQVWQELCDTDSQAAEIEAEVERLATTKA